MTSDPLGTRHHSFYVRRTAWLACLLSFLVWGLVAQQRPPSQPAPPQTSSRASALSKQALAEFERGDYKQAAQDFQTVCNSDSRDASVRLGLGVSLASMGDLGRALAALKQANALSPGDVQVLLALAKVEIALREFEPAKAYLLQAGKLEPHNPQVGLLTVRCYSSEKQNRRAVEKIRSLSAQFPQDAALQGELSRMLLEAGALHAAVSEFDTTYKLDPALADKDLEETLRSNPASPGVHAVAVNRFQEWNHLAFCARCHPEQTDFAGALKSLVCGGPCERDVLAGDVNGGRSN